MSTPATTVNPGRRGGVHLPTHDGECDQATTRHRQWPAGGHRDRARPPPMGGRRRDKPTDAVAVRHRPCPRLTWGRNARDTATGVPDPMAGRGARGPPIAVIPALPRGSPRRDDGGAEAPADLSRRRWVPCDGISDSKDSSARPHFYRLRRHRPAHRRGGRHSLASRSPLPATSLLVC